MTAAASATVRIHNFTSQSPAGNLVSRTVFLSLLSAGVLAFGATEPWSLLMMQLGGVAVLLAWIGTSRPIRTTKLGLGLVLLMLFGVLVVFQIALHRSAYNYASEKAILATGVPLMCFILGKQLLDSEESRSHFSLWAQVFGGLLAAFAIVQAFAGNGKIYWLRTTDVLSFFGPYANRNHYAGLLEMLLPFTLVSAALESRQGKRSLSAFAAALMLASVFLSGSRTGMVIVLFEVAVVLVLALINDLQRLRISSAVLIPCAVALVIWIAGDAALARLSTLRHLPTDADAVNRWQIARDSFQLIRARPIMGWGFGTFSTVYPRVSTVFTDSIVNAGHDDYLQLLVETGIAGTSLILAFLWVVFRRGLAHVRSHCESAVAAALLGCAGLLLHSFGDFNLQISANAAIFFALCGLICASTGSNQVRPRRTL